MKLFPYYGISLMFTINHSATLEIYDKLLDDIKRGKYDDLEVMHHLSAGMKSIYSQICQDALFVIRQSIGGAGYSAWSGIPYLIDDFSHNTTVEGDNTLMAQ